SGRSFLLRQYSASFGTDQFENGSPRSAGLESATSTSSRSCPARRIGGRPLGFGTRSKVLKPLSLKRLTQSYATVKWQPTRSAASRMVRPLRTSSMIRYRWWTRTESERSFTFRASKRRSLLRRGRSSNALGIPHLLSEARITRIRHIKLDQH